MSWGKKDKGSSAPAVNSYIQNQNNSGNNDTMMMYQMMLQSMMNMSSAQQQPPPRLAMPEIPKVMEIDWSEKNKQLNAKAKADYSLQQNRRKGIMDTIHTSPLLEDEPGTTSSILK